MYKHIDEQLAESAFREYYGDEKWLSWKTLYGDRPYSTYWSAPEQERQSLKEELGIAKEQSNAYSKAEQVFESIRTAVTTSGLPADEARELTGNLLVNVFREESLRTTDLKEELFWEETLRDHAEAERANTRYEDPENFTVDLLEESRSDIAERLQHLIVPITKNVNAGDLRAETVSSRFSEWKSWLHEYLERREESQVRDSEARSTVHEDKIYLLMPEDEHEFPDDEITRIVFGDEKGGVLWDKDQSRSDDPLSRMRAEERAEDERSR